MINLDYFYRTDSYELPNLLKNGLAYDYYKTGREYGFSYYLTDKANININNKNIVARIHFKNLDNILVVKNFNELKTEHLLPLTATAATNINITSAPDMIGITTIESGDIIGLGAQTNAQENGKYLSIGAGLPLQRYVDVNSYINTYGITERVGTKVVQPYMEANGYSGLHITSEHLMVLYNTNNIRYIKVYDNK